VQLHPYIKIHTNGQNICTPDIKNIYKQLEIIISNLGYSSHILNTGHTYGTITDVLDIIRTHRKGEHLNTLGEYHIK
jgi:hypothetical protein